MDPRPGWIEAAAEGARTVALGMLRERGPGGLAQGRPAASQRPREPVPNRSPPGLLRGADRPGPTPRPDRFSRGASPADIALSAPAQQSRLAESYRQARTNPLWEPLEQLVQQQLRLDLPSRPGLIGKPTPQDPALADFLLLIIIVVAFLEATAHQLKPLQPILVIGFSGITFAGDNPGDSKEA
jgi:hypothetical protein